MVGSVGGRCDGVGDVGGFGVPTGGEAGGGRRGGVGDDQGLCLAVADSQDADEQTT